MVARTLPGKQYEVGRRIRVLVVRALRRAGIVSSDANAPMVASIPHSSETPAEEEAAKAAPEQKQ
jgi:moderate conductance mechanosensitive channel